MCVIPHPMGGIPVGPGRSKIRDVFPRARASDLTDWRPTAASSLVARRVEERLRFTGTVSELHAEFFRRGWSAGLPFIPPTRELVDELLSGTSHAADEVVWDGVPPRMGVLTVELVAACAAMAGCTAEHMPVLLAIVDALQDPAAWYAHQATTTGTESLMLLVNGPIVDAIGLAFGTGAAGLCYPPNAAHRVRHRAHLEGRRRLETARSGQVDARLASRSPQLGHRGERARQSVGVHSPSSTGFGDWRGRGHGQGGVSTDRHQRPSERDRPGAAALHRALHQPAVRVRHATPPVLLGLCPEHAATLANDGFSKDAIRDYLWENAGIRPRCTPGRPGMRARSSRTRISPTCTSASDARLPIVAKPEDFQIIVCGGAGKHSHFWPGPKGIVSRAEV